MLKGTLKIIAIIATIIIAAAYVVSLCAVIIPPEKSPLIASMGMGIHVLWFLLMLAVIFWLIFRKWNVLINLVILLALSFPLWRNTIIVPINKQVDSEDKEIKIMTYNVRMFDYFNKFDEIYAIIEAEDADIVCLQEFGHYSNPKNKQQSSAYVLSQFNKTYPYSHRWYKNQYGRSENGLATFSKYPIVNKEKVMYDSKYNVSILSDIAIGKDTVRLINNHLESNKLTRKQRAIAKHIISEHSTTESIISSTKNISETLGKAGNIRTQQAKKIKEYVKHSPYPTIVCGDFNDVPQSYVYRTIKADMNSAYTSAGSWGYYWTYNQSMMYFPIDHILIDKQYKIKEAKVIKEAHSDHYPLVATFYIETT